MWKRAKRNLPEHGERVRTDASPKEASNQPMTICDHVWQVIQPWSCDPARPQHADTIWSPARPTGRDTGVPRPTSIRPLGVWNFLSRSPSNTGTIGIRHMGSWDPRHSMHTKMLKCVRSGRE